jgi:asparagine synthase (glutamine-hydrolysing)
MCGLAGYVVSPDASGVDLAGMVRALSHRGPDDEGQAEFRLADARVGFGHRRLSILDLSAAGHQPMTLPDGSLTLVFNGEIYNHPDLRRELTARGHRFVGSSDTETLLHWLHEFGPTGLPKVEGMYSCGWADHRTGGVFLARDPFGIKPLYHARVSGGCVFASEVRSVLASGAVSRRVDRAGFATLLAYGAVQAPFTIAVGIREFPAGSWARVTPDGLAVTRFFEYPQVRPESREAPDAECASLFRRAIGSHLMSDVPVGVLLSSGIDSRLVAAEAAAQSPGVRSFTLGFAEDPAGSETSAAAEFAHSRGLKHTDVVLSETDCLAALEGWVCDLDQPSVDGLNVYLITRAVRQEGIKVALSGLGADELFGGYPSFTDVPWLSRVARLGRSLPSPLKGALAGLLTLRRGGTAREKLTDIMSTGRDFRRVYLHRRRLMSDARMAALNLSPQPLGLGDDFQVEGTSDPSTGDAVADVSRLECRYYQGNMLLRDSDATSMANGLELRVPFLDQRLAEFALALPAHVRCPTPGKPLLRRMLSERYGVDAGTAAKRGFTLPMTRWLLGPLRGLAEHALACLQQSGLVTPAGVQRVWEEFTRHPESPAWSRAFVLVAAGSYLDRQGLS